MSKAKKMIMYLGEKLTEKDFADEIDIHKYEGFLKEYSHLGLDKQIEEKDGEYFLIPKVRKELARTYNLFVYDRGLQDKREKGILAGLKSQAMDAVKKVAKDLKINTSGLKVDSWIAHDFDSATASISWKGEDLELDAGFYLGQEDGGAIMDGACSSWDWAAWLGSWDSPFFQESFYDAYLDDNRSQAAEELANLNSQGNLEKQVRDFLERVAEL